MEVVCDYSEPHAELLFTMETEKITILMVSASSRPLREPTGTPLTHDTWPPHWLGGDTHNASAAP